MGEQKKAASELVAAAQGSAVTAPSHHDIAETAKEFEREIEWRIESASQVLSTLGYVTGAVAIGAGFNIALPLAAVFLPAPLLFGFLAGYGSDLNKRNARHIFEDAQAEITDAFNKARKYAYRDNQKTLIALADKVLESGGVLDEQALSYLAAVPPELLQGASDRLAITVLQARGAIARAQGGTSSVMTYSRLAQEHSDELDADISFSGANEKHRSKLRHALERRNAGITEDWYIEKLPHPVIPELRALPGTEQTQEGLGRKILRVIAQPLFVIPDVIRIERLRKSKLPEIKTQIAVPALEPVADFSAILAQYERETGESLDLPALRGEGKTAPAPAQPKALPKKRVELKPR